MKPGETPNDDAQRHERRTRAAQLRLEGRSYREIATLLEVDVHTAWEDVHAVRREMRRPTVRRLEAEREKDLATIEVGIAALADKYEAGEVSATMGVCKLLERKAKTIGSDAPTKLQHSEAPIKPDEDIRAVRAKLVEALADVDKQIAEAEVKH